MSGIGTRPAFVSAVVPVYNSESVVPLLVDRLRPVLDGVSHRWELILVNDASQDKSWSVICDLASADSRLVGLDLMRNFGQHNALLCGIRAARGEIVVTLDDDLQNPPEEIPKLINELLTGFDVVYGTPSAERHGLMRDAASILTKMALKQIMGVDAARNVSAFRAFRIHLRNAFSEYRGTQFSLDVLLAWGTSRFSAVRVRHDARRNGQSNYTLGKLISIGLNLCTGFTTVPLRLASIIGFVFTLFGIGVLAFVLVEYVKNRGSIPGFPFLASLTAIFSGAQLFALGILGEYLARIHSRTMDRPTYAVRTTIGLETVAGFEASPGQLDRPERVAAKSGVD